MSGSCQASIPVHVRACESRLSNADTNPRVARPHTSLISDVDLSGLISVIDQTTTRINAVHGVCVCGGGGRGRALLGVNHVNIYVGIKFN